MAQTPTPPEVPDGLTEDERQNFLERHGQAYNLQHKSAGAYLTASAHTIINSRYPVASFETYIANVLDGCGDPSDPITRMMVEQLALAHHNIGRLYVRAANSQDPQRAAVFDKAAARLLGEFRRLALALKEYRTPANSRAHLIIRQQNVAGSQQIAYVDPIGRKLDGPKKDPPRLDTS